MCFYQLPVCGLPWERVGNSITTVTTRVEVGLNGTAIELSSVTVWVKASFENLVCTRNKKRWHHIGQHLVPRWSMVCPIDWVSLWVSKPAWFSFASQILPNERSQDLVWLSHKVVLETGVSLLPTGVYFYCEKHRMIPTTATSNYQGFCKLVDFNMKSTYLLGISLIQLLSFDWLFNGGLCKNFLWVETQYPHLCN